MWNRKKYIRTLDEIVKKGVFEGENIGSKKKLYEAIAKRIPAGEEAVRSWTREGSNGPGDTELREELEVVLKLKVGSLYISKYADEEEKEMSMELSEFCKKNIMECYGLMKGYLRDDEMESEECFARMCLEVEKKQVGIPKCIYDKIDNFINANLAPIIYEKEDVFASCFSSDLGEFDEDGAFCINSEESGERFAVNFLTKVMEIEDKLDEFGMKELYPYLV